MKVNNKFKIGDVVYFMNNNRITRGKIAYIRILASASFINIEYELASYGSACGGGTYSEVRLYKTREDLIKIL